MKTSGLSERNSARQILLISFFLCPHLRSARAATGLPAVVGSLLELVFGVFAEDDGAVPVGLEVDADVVV
jgi:inner membrane protein involved in colicin E2 resistance